MSFMLQEIRSGGQTGADEGGLRAGLALGLRTGGWIPKGRRTENGAMSDADFKMFGLEEHAFEGYPPRTEDNVLETDGTVLFGDMNSPGSRLTVKYCRMNGAPYICNPLQDEFVAWLDKYAIRILNVAGNRESKSPGIMIRTKDFLVSAIEKARTELAEVG